ncbi:MAG: helix-turn-helix domain-containing protein [Phycisphaerae bacterium]
MSSLPYPAPMPESPHPVVTELIAGHFHETLGYHTFRAHGTTDWLLIYTCSGHGRIGYQPPNQPPRELLTARGDMILYQPGALHDYGVSPPPSKTGSKPAGRRGRPHPGTQGGTYIQTRKKGRGGDSWGAWELRWAHFHPRPSWLEYLAWPVVAPGLLHLTLTNRQICQRIVQRLDDASRLAGSSRSHRTALAMNALEEVILWCDSVNPNLQQARLDDRIQAALDYLCRNLSAPITLPRLADACGLSVSRLAHLFRQQVNSTPQQFLELQRLNRAKQLLELSSHSIKQIAHEVGFANPFYFTLRFKRHTGLSPRAYREKLNLHT